MRNFSKNQNHFKHFVEKQNICITKKKEQFITLLKFTICLEMVIREFISYTIEGK